MPNVRAGDGVTISYSTAGDGPLNLLFLHGWGGSGRYFDEMLKHMRLAGLRAVLPSYRGHGDSDKPATGYTLEQFANDMSNNLSCLLSKERGWSCCRAVTKSHWSCHAKL